MFHYILIMVYHHTPLYNAGIHCTAHVPAAREIHDVVYRRTVCRRRNPVVGEAGQGMTTLAKVSTGKE
jgi:hypothetical protein